MSNYEWSFNFIPKVDIAFEIGSRDLLDAQLIKTKSRQPGNIKNNYITYIFPTSLFSFCSCVSSTFLNIFFILSYVTNGNKHIAS